MIIAMLIVIIAFAALMIGLYLDIRKERKEHDLKKQKCETLTELAIGFIGVNGLINYFKQAGFDAAELVKLGFDKDSVDEIYNQ